WLSREVLLFTLFFFALCLLTGFTWFAALRGSTFPALTLPALGIFASLIGIAGVLSSARIYLVPARPAWNTVHTPLDFLLSSALLGCAAIPLLLHTTLAIRELGFLGALPPIGRTSVSGKSIILAATLWMLNQIVRTIRLHRSSTYEHRACASLI